MQRVAAENWPGPVQAQLKLPSGAHSVAFCPAHTASSPVIEAVGDPVTVTLKLQVATLPHGSVAVAVTVVVPTWNTVPDGGLKTTVIGPAQASVAVVL